MGQEALLERGHLRHGKSMCKVVRENLGVTVDKLQKTAHDLNGWKHEAGKIKETPGQCCPGSFDPSER